MHDKNLFSIVFTIIAVHTGTAITTRIEYIITYFPPSIPQRRKYQDEEGSKGTESTVTASTSSSPFAEQHNFNKWPIQRLNYIKTYDWIATENKRLGYRQRITWGHGNDRHENTCILVKHSSQS
jgi:hypothetical protein